MWAFQDTNRLGTSERLDDRSMIALGASDRDSHRALPTRVVVAELRALILEVRRRVARGHEQTLFHFCTRGID